MIERDHHERVADFFVGDELGDFGRRHEPRFKVFAVIEFHAVLQAAVFDGCGCG